jgi:eukaryotic translation initiation factor 2C
MIAANDPRTNRDIAEQRIMVNFDVEKGRQPRDPANPDTCYCQIKRSKVIRLAVIQGYLNQQIPFDNVILESISMFLGISSSEM